MTMIRAVAITALVLTATLAHAEDVGDLGTAPATARSGAASAAHVGHVAGSGLGALADFTVGHVMAVADDHGYDSLRVSVDQGF